MFELKTENAKNQKRYRERHQIRRVILKQDAVKDLEILRRNGETDTAVIARILRLCVATNNPKERS